VQKRKGCIEKRDVEREGKGKEIGRRGRVVANTLMYYVGTNPPKNDHNLVAWFPMYFPLKVIHSQNQ
jgi:hypothetical protein